VLAIGRQFRVCRRTGPQRKAIVMLGGEDDVSGAGIVKDFGHRVGIPLLNFAVEGRGEIVIVIIGAIMLAMVGLRG